MSTIPLSRHHDRRLQNISDRLTALLDTLGAVTDRKAPLPPNIAGPIRRTLGEAERLLDMPPQLPRDSANPGDLFVGAMVILRRLDGRFREIDQYLRTRHGKSYARSPAAEVN